MAWTDEQLEDLRYLRRADKRCQDLQIAIQEKEDLMNSIMDECVHREESLIREVAYGYLDEEDFCDEMGYYPDQKDIEKYQEEKRRNEEEYQ